MTLFDPSRSMIPIDPNSPEGAGVVDPVAPVGSVGSGRGRAFLDRLGSGRYSFPDQPAVLPYRPTVGSALVAGTQGFLKGLSAGQEVKMQREAIASAKEERVADRALRERTLDENVKQSKASQAAEDLKLNAEIRSNVIRTIRETPGLADFARNTNADVTGLLTRYYSGKTSPEEERMVTTGLAYAMKDETLPKDLKDAISIRTVALGPDATPDKIAAMRAKTTEEYLKTVGDPIKRLKSTMDDAQKARELIDAQIANLEGTDLRALAPEMTQAVGRAQQNLIDAASLALKDNADPQGFINDLLAATPEARSHAMATLPTPTGKDGKPDEKILQTFDRAVEEFKRMQEVQSRVVQKLGKRAGVDIPAFSSQVGLPPAAEAPPPGEVSGLSLFDSPDKIEAARIPNAPEAVTFRPGESPSPFIAPGGPVPVAGGEGIGFIAESATSDPDPKRQRSALAFVANQLSGKLVYPDGPNAGRPVVGADGQPLSYEQTFRLLESMQKKFGAEKTRNYIHNLLAAPAGP